MKVIIIFMLSVILNHSFLLGAIYYTSPSGNDNNSGTINSPFFTLNKAWTKVYAGDTIYVRGGVYYYTVVQRLQNKSGTVTNPIRVLAYSNERPVFNFGTAGFSIATIALATGWSNYIHVRGIRITNLPQVTDCNHGFMLASSSNFCTIENCEFDHIGGYGLTISSNCDNNLILNCDSHHNEDPLSTIPYDGSNGFGMTNNTTSDNNIFRGCRSWFNSDDGFDFFGTNTYIELDNCWSFLNGYSPTNMTHTGNGCGFKMGPNTNGILTTYLRKLTDCMAYDNYMNGFEENFSSNGLNHFPSILYNCTAFRNGNYGFNYSKFNDAHILKNNLSYLNIVNYAINTSSIVQNNSWNGTVTVSTSDFISIDTIGMSGPRQADGSLPVLNFLHLASGSDLIDAGVNVGLPYVGSAPDICTFEYSGSTNQAPVITNQTFSINENSVNGTAVGTVIAYDPDAGQILTYSILSGNTNNAFAINSTTGIITVANSVALNYESTPSFTMVVKVQDNGNSILSSQATVTINLININEPPVITNQSFSINENSVNGASVGTVVASDPDAGQTKTFSILSGNTNSSFSINSTNGNITVANSAALNFESTPSYALVVKVQDNGTGNLSSQATVTILLINVNEPPAISNQSFSINENSTNGATVGTVSASDVDAGQTLTYSILSGNTNTAFAINSATGIITVANSAALNFESTPSYALVVKVQDNGTGNLSNQATVTINLININEPPVISNQSFSVTSGSVNGTTVGTVAASDPDAGQVLTYSIISGNTSNGFIINSSTGLITINNEIVVNYTTNPLFSLLIKVQDNGTGNLYDDAIITINVVQAGNLPPVITNQNFNLNENAPNGATVGTVVASDPNSGQTLTYSILSGNADNAFTINALSGVLSVANSASINFESLAVFNLIIKVQDNGTGNLSSQATITVNILNLNELPVIANQAFSTNENSANGTTVGTVIATDPDAGQTLNFTILSGNSNTAFSISSTTGIITVANSSALNFETSPSFALVVKVQDNGAGYLSSQATVTITLLNINEPPVITNQSFAINENSANGTAVGTVIASDPDAGQTKTFSILSGNTNTAFAISSTTGIITVANSAALNFESTPSFALVIKVQDNGTGNLSSQATVTINLINTNEPPVIINQSFSINENSSNGTTVGTVIATDPDAGQTKTFSILSGNTNTAFAISSTTGIITVANSAALNFESTPSFALVIKVQDNGAGSLSSQATVTITLININEPPVITNQSFSINENSVNGTAVGTVIATDPDAGQTKTFSILSGNTNSTFVINSLSGVISVANSSALNFEATPSYDLIVKVQDNGTGNLSSQATVMINLININEPPVVNNQTFTVTSGSANGTSVGIVAASDPDAGQILTYSIISGNTSSAFIINSSSGQITVNNAIVVNYTTNPVFSLLIKVQDNGTGNLYDDATITINVLQAGNMPPVITNQTFNLNENAPNGSTVGAVVASDPNAGQTLTYSILSGNTNNAFIINAISGLLSVANSTAINFESITAFNLIIKVQDNGTGNLSSQATITVNILNLNEVPLITNQAFSINENSSNGVSVGMVIATDPDAGQLLTFSILSGNTNGAFAINSATGVIIVTNSGALNFETIPSFALVVKVHDNGSGNLSSQATVTITLLNINEQPVISNQSFSINENSANGTTVGTVIATDPDAGQTLTYSILSGNTGGAFAINSTNGNLIVTNSTILNYEVTPFITIAVKVQDNGTGNLYNQGSITININNINEQPILSNQIFNVYQFTANGSSLGTVLATDPDAGQALTYSIIAGNVNNGFGINPVSGVLFVNNSSALNPGTTPVFYLSIQVMDNGYGNLTNSAVSTINILATGNQPPVITNQSFTLNENSANGTIVGTVIASDPNVGQSITYSIISGNTNGAFAINASSGQLVVSNSASINFELIPTFSLIIKVQDNGTGSLSSQATITINISNLNEPPIISNQIFSVSENSSNGTIVGTVVASDPDAGQSLTYTILSGNTSGAFAINSANGTLIVANSAALNYELITSFVLVIKVQDNGVGLLSSQANATVNLLNVNDSPNINNQAFAIEENSMNGTTIGTVEAQDQDVSQLLTYQIISGNPGGAFYINNATGKLLVSNSSVLDFENQSTFQITISVSDNGNPNSSSQATITINLIDIEDVLFTAPTVYSNGSLNNYLTNGGSSHFEDSLTMQNHDNGDTKIEWSIYPNPSGGIINVEIPGLQAEWILINIFNVEGKTVYVHKMDNVNKEVLDLGQLPSGTYYMLIQSEDKKSSKKFIIR